MKIDHTRLLNVFTHTHALTAELAAIYYGLVVHDHKDPLSASRAYNAIVNALNSLTKQGDLICLGESGDPKNPTPVYALPSFKRS